MSRKANPSNLGKKINESHIVWQVTKLIYEGVPDMQIGRILRDRYAFKVSVPNIASFRVNFYENRLVDLKRDSEEFQEKNTGRIKSFIDVSLTQARAIKEDINAFNKQLKILEEELTFISKFDKVFQNAFDKYVEKYDPADPGRFLESDSSEEERRLKEIIETMGAGGNDVLANYCRVRTPHGLVKLMAILRSKVLDQRNALVKIHREIFKGYKNFSIMQELTMVFEKYNGLIIEEFFPDRQSMDKSKYFRVRKRILALFDELQIRYQGVESPSSDRQAVPTPEQALEFSGRVAEDVTIIDTKGKEEEPVPKSGLEGRPLSKYKQAQSDKKVGEKKKTTRKHNTLVKSVKNTSSFSDADVEILTEDQAQIIMEEAEAQIQARQRAGGMENLFSNIINSADLGEDVLSDLDAKAEEKHEKVSRETVVPFLESKPETETREV